MPFPPQKNAYHLGKIVTIYKDAALYTHVKTDFMDGTTHSVIYNKDMIWLSSIVEDIYGRTYERVESIDENGEIIIGYPSVVIDGNGNEHEL